MSDTGNEEGQRITAIVLNWNDAERTERAVRSLLAQVGATMRIIIVDNGSGGGEATVLGRSFLDDAVDVLALPVNVGFARAVNAGAVAAMRAGAEYVLLFNNDASIDPSSTAIADCLQALQGDPTLGATGPIICNDDAARTIQSSTYMLSMWLPIPRASRVVIDRARLGSTSYLSGSCLLLRAEAFGAVNGLDPDFFLYGDDVDLARRLLLAGYHERLIPVRGVAHVRAASTRLGSAQYVYTALRSNLILLSKHARWYHLPSAISTTVAASATLAVLGLWRREPEAPYAVFRAWRDFLQGRWGGYSGDLLATATRPSVADLRITRLR